MLFYILLDLEHSLVHPKNSTQYPAADTININIHTYTISPCSKYNHLEWTEPKKKKKILFGTTGVMDSRYVSPRILSRQVPAVSNAVFNCLNCTAVTAKPTTSPSKGSLLNLSTPSPFFQGMEVEVRIFGFDAHIYQKSLWRSSRDRQVNRVGGHASCNFEEYITSVLSQTRSANRSIEILSTGTLFPYLNTTPLISPRPDIDHRF